MAERSPEHEPVTPRLASTVLLIRDSIHGIEIYVQERVSTMRFAPNMTVFPGGGVDARDFPGDVDGDGHDSPRLRWAGPDARWWSERFDVTEATARALVCAAVRETFEETGTLLAADAAGETIADSSRFHARRKALESHELAFSDFLHDEGLTLRADLLRPWSNWVTPEQFPKRYDTFFFVAAQPAGQIADGDTSEASSTGWFRPTVLLDGWRDGMVGLMPPTWAQIKRMSRFDTVAEVLAAADAADAPVERTQRDFFDDPFMDEYFTVATHMGHLRGEVAPRRRG
ncbi:NUDIX hydrolase [uncultured Corynebacterium sp.]|uniref:NUDIX hydrolase n=1 Tax=uncultured Corynebacterium sp. TaxID=159447 RepID=UPI0025E19D5D|nr:NUDIX hydrolase [uncultured Corynebacterium sp.]